MLAWFSVEYSTILFGLTLLARAKLKTLVMGLSCTTKSLVASVFTSVPTCLINAWRYRWTISIGNNFPTIRKLDMARCFYFPATATATPTARRHHGNRDIYSYRNSDAQIDADAASHSAAKIVGSRRTKVLTIGDGPEGIVRLLLNHLSASGRRAAKKLE